MNYKKILSFLMSVALGLSMHMPLSYCRAQVLPPDIFNDPQQKEIFDFVSSLDQEQQEQLLNEIFEEVSKLPEDQQREFWQEVEQEAVKLEEQIKQAESLEISEPAQQDSIIRPAEPIAPPLREPEIAETEIKAPPVQDIIKAEHLVESLIQEIERLLKKIALIPGIEAHINDWITTGRIHYIPAGTTWLNIQHAMNTYKYALYQLLERDMKTHKHKHLNVFIEHENIQNNLSHLERILITQGPRIEVPDFGTAQLTTETRASIQQALSAIAESFYVLKTPEELDAIIAQYAPHAQKIKQEQDQLQKTARMQAERPRRATPLTRAGTAPVEPRTDQTATYRPFRPEYSMPVFTEPERPTLATMKSPQERGTTAGSTGGTPTPTMAGTPKTGDHKSPAGRSSGRTDFSHKKSDSGEKKSEEKKPTEDLLIKEYMSSLIKNLEMLSDLINGSKLKSIRSYMLASSPVDNELANKTIPTVISLFDKIIPKIDTLKSRIAKQVKDPSQQKKYQDDVRGILSAYKSSFEKVANEIKFIQANPSISANKRYAYLADKKAKVRDATLLDEVKIPASLPDLRNKIEKFIKQIAR